MALPQRFERRTKAITSHNRGDSFQDRSCINSSVVTEKQPLPSGIHRRREQQTVFNYSMICSGRGLSHVMRQERLDVRSHGFVCMISSTEVARVPLLVPQKSVSPVGPVLQLHPPRFWIGFWRWVVGRFLMTGAMLLAASSGSYACSPVRSTCIAPKDPDNVQTSAKRSLVFRVKTTKKASYQILLATRLVLAADWEAWAAVSSKFMPHASGHVARGRPPQVVAQAHARAC